MNAIVTNTVNIHGRAMLVTLNIAQWSARKIDKKAAAEVALDNSVQSTKGTYYKSLVEGGALDEIKVLATKARAAHYRRTLPWSDAGPRVLPNLAYFDYVTEMGQYGAEFDKLVQQFIAEYPLLRQEASRLLGTLFNDAEYPTVQDVAHRFNFRTAVMPLPMGDDFRCDLGSEEVDRIRAEITATTQAAASLAVRDAYERVAKIADSFVDRLSSPTTVFRDSLVDNARELAEVLPSLNFTDDPRLTDIAQRLKDKLCAHDPAALRLNTETRRQTFDAAMAIKSDLLDFFGGQL